MQRYETIKLDSDSRDANGFYRDTPIVGRSGLLKYYVNGKERIEYRPPEEAFKADSLATLMGVPITNKHPKTLVGNDNFKNSKPIGAVLSEGRKDGDGNIVADIVIYDLEQCGKNRELSCGYTVETIEKAGTTPDGQRYDAIQTNIVYNHLAVVPRGRAGNAKLHLDSEGNQIKEEQTMKKYVVDGKEFEIEEELSAHLDAMISAKDKEIAEKSVELEKAKANADAKDAEIAKLKEGFGDAVKARIALERTGEKFGVEKMDEKSDKEIKVSVVNKVYPDVKLDDKSDDYLNAMFDIAVTQDVNSKSKVAENNKKMDSQVVEKSDSEELTLENIADFDGF